MSANSVFSKEFNKTVGGFLAEACATGAAVTRPELAKVIRKAYGRKLDYKNLNMWLSSSINLGLFDTEDSQFITKRGVNGGIVMVGAAAAQELPAPAPKARKARPRTVGAAASKAQASATA